MADSNGNRKPETGQGNASNSPLAQAVKSKRPPPIPADAKARTPSVQPPIPQAAQAKPMEEPAAGRVTVPASPLAQAVKGGAQVGAPEIAKAPEPVVEESPVQAQQGANVAVKAKAYERLYKQVTNPKLDIGAREKAMMLAIAAGEEQDLVTLGEFVLRCYQRSHGPTPLADTFFGSLNNRDEHLVINVLGQLIKYDEINSSLKCIDVLLTHIERLDYPDWSLPHLESAQEMIDSWGQQYSGLDRFPAWYRITTSIADGIQTITARELGIST